MRKLGYKMQKCFLLIGFIVFFFSIFAFSQNYPIVDTGQDICYDSTHAISPPQPGEPFYGQDAQFFGNQPGFTISNDSLTVYDNVTRLTWIRTPDTDEDGDLDTYDQLSWTEFLSYPATLNAQNYGGYNDWRTPSIKELYSLIDFRGLDPSGPNPLQLLPFIDTDYFTFVYGDTTVGERLIDAQYWSNNEYTGLVFGSQPAVFGVNFADGRIKGYPRDPIGNNPSIHYARYVSGNPDYGINNFVDNGNGTITDSATGLMWSKDDRGNGVNIGPRSGMKWEDALAWVQQKNNENYLGYNDWRLPNAKEMQSILDYSRSPDATGSAAIDPVFNTTEITNEVGEIDYPWYWTSTTHVKSNGMGDAGAYICFGRSLGYMMNSWLDVHGAGAQRSDRKGHDFSGFVYIPDGYYFPMAPQGDATRIFNYVRLVRGGSISGVKKTETILPDEYKLDQNFPNPFNPSTTISFELPVESKVILKIFNAIGQQVDELVNENLPAGSYSFQWNAKDQPSGVYFYKLVADSFSAVKKMIYLK
jgi:hypothetical protein